MQTWWGVVSRVLKIATSLRYAVSLDYNYRVWQLKNVPEKVKKLQFLCQQNIFLHKQHTVEAEKRLALNHFCFRI